MFFVGLFCCGIFLIFEVFVFEVMVRIGKLMRIVIGVFLIFGFFVFIGCMLGSGLVGLK